ncbi:MAG: signal recognition particle-docking protein FtsY [Candidatus Altiarchaeales archaeon]|nr:signal recognition particle-docking protein FtsY [Candidatus Altiarchaeales archaeon]
MFGLLREKLSSFVGDVADNTQIKVSASTKIKSITSDSIVLSEKDLEDTLWEFNLNLLQADVSSETAEYLTQEIAENLRDRKIPKNRLKETIQDTLKSVLTQTLKTEEIDLLENIKAGGKPYLILFLGVNGTGKTTTMAKLARKLMDENLDVVFAAGDTFRAGAIEQLKTHADKLDVKLVSHQRGADAAAVIYDAVEHAQAKNIDVVLADTAGRMQTNKNLMDELNKIVKVNKPDLTLFIGDSLCGNDAIKQAETFNELVGFDAAVLTKMDADSRGGAALSITHITGKPILYVGLGQSYEDLKPFEPEWFINQLIN